MMDEWLFGDEQYHKSILSNVLRLFQERPGDSKYVYRDQYNDVMGPGMNKLRLQHPELCDVCIKTAENDVPAHSLVLATLCDYFKTLFTTTMRCKGRNEDGLLVVDFAEFSQISVELLLKLMYNYEELCLDDFIEVDVLEFMVMLDFIGLSFVQQLLIDAIRSHISESTWSMWYEFVDQYGLSKLKAIVLTYIGDNFETLSVSKQFKCLSFEQVFNIFSCELITCHPHNAMVNAIASWIKFDAINRSKHIKAFEDNFPALAQYMISGSHSQHSAPSKSVEISTGKWFVQECILISNLRICKEPFDVPVILFELNRENSNAKCQTPKLSKLHLTNFLCHTDLQKATNCKHFLWQNRLFIVADEKQRKLNIFNYQQLDRKLIKYHTIHMRKELTLKCATCVDDTLFVLMEATFGFYIYFVNLLTRESSRIYDTWSVDMIVGVNSSAVRCISFSQEKLISSDIEVNSPTSFIECHQVATEILERSEKHFVVVLEKVYCFLKDSHEQKVVVLEKGPEKFENEWTCCTETSCYSSIVFLFTLQRRVFALLEGKTPVQKQTNDKHFRHICEFNLDDKAWSNTIYTCDELDIDPELAPMLMPRHILY